MPEGLTTDIASKALSEYGLLISILLAYSVGVTRALWRLVISYQQQLVEVTKAMIEMTNSVSELTKTIERESK